VPIRAEARPTFVEEDRKVDVADLGHALKTVVPIFVPVIIILFLLIIAVL
jgi:hypothetical protein